MPRSSSGSGETTPLKPMPEPFVATWPSPLVANLRVRYYLRYAVAAYAVVSLIAVIVNAAISLDATFHVVRDTAFGAAGIMVALMVFEADVCGFRSLLFSTFWVGIFYLIAHTVSDFPSSLYGLLISLPPVWWCTSSLFRLVASFLIVPAQFTFNGMNGRFKSLRSYDDEVIQSGRQYMMDYLGAEEVKITTADGVTIDAMFFPSPHSHSPSTSTNTPNNDSPNGGPIKITTPLAPSQVSAGVYSSHPTVIMVNANNESYELKQPDIEMYLKNGFSLMSFNYRGVSHSEGSVSRDGTILDADACFQYVHKALGVRNSMIVMAGSSLGGAVATEVAAMHPGCSLVNDRSFSNLVTEAQEVAPAMFGFEPSSPKGRVIGVLLSTLVAYSGWNYVVTRHWHRVKGPKFLIHHPEDGIIPETARLYTALKSEATLRVLHMTHTRHEEECDRAEIGQIAHCRPLSASEAAKYMELLKSGLPDMDHLMSV